MQPEITYTTAKIEDLEPIYLLCRKLILTYEDLEKIDCDRVLDWVRRKLEQSLGEYTAVYLDGHKVGYYHFYKNGEDRYEIDDLYIFPQYQNKGIGSTIIRKCCSAVREPVMLYVFIKNKRAVSLYQRLGFAVVETIQDSRYIMRREWEP